MKKNILYKLNDYTMRLSEQNDFNNYYEGNFNPVSDSLVRFTGCQKYFEKDKVEKFFLSCIEDESRVDFLLFNGTGKVIGEVVLNDIETDVRQANFRIGIFNENESGKGLGTWAIKNILEYGFQELKLNRIYLDVFSYNERAIHLYKKMGFSQEGLLRESILDGDEYADDVLMSILRKEWKK